MGWVFGGGVRVCVWLGGGGGGSLRECRWVTDAVVQSLAEAVGPAGRLEELDLSWTAVTDQARAFEFRDFSCPYLLVSVSLRDFSCPYLFMVQLDLSWTAVTDQARPRACARA